MRGGSSSAPEVTRIEPDGLWLRVDGREFLLPFADFPWFATASGSDIYRVESPHHGHLRWPALDIDLTVDSIEHPERYPLVARRAQAED